MIFLVITLPAIKKLGTSFCPWGNNIIMLCLHVYYKNGQNNRGQSLTSHPASIIVINDMVLIILIFQWRSSLFVHLQYSGEVSLDCANASICFRTGHFSPNSTIFTTCVDPIPLHGIMLEIISLKCLSSQVITYSYASRTNQNQKCNAGHAQKVIIRYYFSHMYDVEKSYDILPSMEYKAALSDFVQPHCSANKTYKESHLVPYNRSKTWIYAKSVLMNWNMAYRHCLKHGSYLLIVKNYDVLNMIKYVHPEDFQPEPIFIGLRYQVNNFYTFSAIILLLVIFLLLQHRSS